MADNKIRTRIVKTISGVLKDIKDVAFTADYNDLLNTPTIPPATAVKGNAETTYRVGNVNLTPANIGLGNVNNTSDADKPISTATQTALNNKVSKTGDTMSGLLTHNGAGTVLKNTNLDVNGDNPTSNTWSNAPLDYHDKDNARMGYVNVQRRTDGSTMLEISAQARNTADTADIYNTIDMYVGRDGTRSYGVASPTAFRKAIGTGNQVTLTGAVTGTGTFDSNGNVASVSTNRKSGVAGNVTNAVLTSNSWFKVATSNAASATGNYNLEGLFFVFESYDHVPINSGSNYGLLHINLRITNGVPVTSYSYIEWLNVTDSMKETNVIAAWDKNTRTASIYVNCNRNTYEVYKFFPITEGFYYNNSDANTVWNMLSNFTGEAYPSGSEITVFTPALAPTVDRTQINYNTNNGVKNLLSTEWFVTDHNPSQAGTVESYDVETGSITGFASASLTGNYLSININVNKMNNVLENGKTYILSWKVDSRTSNGIFGFRRADNNAYSVGGAAAINRTGNYSVTYTHNASIPVYFSFCINIAGTSSDKRIAISNLMLREATIEDDTFVPYAKSNAELTSGKLDATGNSGTPYDQLPDHFELWTTPGVSSSNGNMFIRMKSYSSSADSFLVLGNDDVTQYFGIEDDCFVVQTKDANSYYEFKDDGIYLNGTRIAP